MNFPKPSAPKAPLSFTPPQYNTEKLKENLSDAVDAAALSMKSFTEAFSKPVEEKKPFVRKPHLTQRPFRDERLLQLRHRLAKPKFQNR